MRVAVVSALLLLLACPSSASAAELFVGPSETHATIQDALDAAVDGDVITVRAGTYEESLETRAPGVTLRAEPGAEAVVQGGGRALRVFHPRVRVEGLVFDGAYGDRDVIDVEDGADGFALVDCEVRRSGRNCVDFGAVSSALVEGSLVHHCLRSSAPDCAEDACRDDAHGIVGGPVQGLWMAEHERTAGPSDVTPARRGPTRATVKRPTAVAAARSPAPAGRGGPSGGRG